MFQKNSYSIPSDSSGIFLVRIIELRKCSTRKHAKIGRFLKVSIRNTKPELLKKRKKKNRAIVIRSKHFFKKVDNLTFNFIDNSLVILKKRMNTFGKEIFGPTSFDLKIKKFRVAFKNIY